MIAMTTTTMMVMNFKNRLLVGNNDTGLLVQIMITVIGCPLL